MDKVRCPSCRGAKKVAKLGGIIGECNTCLGIGQINAADKVAIVILESMPNELGLIKDAVCAAIPWKDDKPKIQDAPIEGNIPVEKIQQAVDSVSKIDPKKAIYKRKKA